jgi:hypothetical protein
MVDAFKIIVDMGRAASSPCSEWMKESPLCS